MPGGSGSYYTRDQSNNLIAQLKINTRLGLGGKKGSRKKIKRNLIKGSAGNVSTTIKIRRINCFFRGSKRRAGGGKRGWRAATKRRAGRGRQGEEGTQEKAGERQLDKIRKIIDRVAPRGLPGLAGQSWRGGGWGGSVPSPWLPTAPGCLLPGKSLRGGAGEGAASFLPFKLPYLKVPTQPGNPQLRPGLGCADPQSPLWG